MERNPERHSLKNIIVINHTKSLFIPVHFIFHLNANDCLNNDLREASACLLLAGGI